VELLVAITLLTVLAVLGFQILALLLKLDQNTLTSRDARRIRERLAEIFREDVHLAQDVTFGAVNNGVQSISLKRADGTVVTYTPGERGLERFIPGVDAAHHRELEMFVLPETEFEFSREQSLLTLRLRNGNTTALAGEAGGLASYPAVIEAAIGRGRQP
jgi:hypothetical protein